MSTQTQTRFAGEEMTLSLSGPWTAYWFAFLRVITGYWFFHAGLGKYMAAEPFSAAWFVGGAAKGSILAPVITPFSSGIGLEFVNFMIPLGQVLIGLGLMLGVLTRLAAFFGSFLMVFFYFVNADWAHGFVSSDLMGMFLFITVIVVGAGRYFGGDAYLEQTKFVKNNRWARYLLG